MNRDKTQGLPEWFSDLGSDVAADEVDGKEGDTRRRETSRSKGEILQPTMDSGDGAPILNQRPVADDADKTSPKVRQLRDELLTLKLVTKDTWARAVAKATQTSHGDDTATILRHLQEEPTEWKSGATKDSHPTLTTYQVKQILGGRSRELRFKDYVVMRKLGSGGMGDVYQVRNLSLFNRLEAIKMIKRATGGATEDASSSEQKRQKDRFEREAMFLATLKHPNLPVIYAAGESDGTSFITMEYVDGHTLEYYVEKGKKQSLKVPFDWAHERMTAMADVLHYAHIHDIVHRDIKPQNIMLCPDGSIKLLDLGIAKLKDDGAKSANPLAGLTIPGGALGTPHFMPPEQWADPTTVDARADIYSLGVTFYFFLTSEVPFVGNNLTEVSMSHTRGEYRPISDYRDDIPADFAAIVHKMIRPRREDRYQSAKEVLQDLKRLRQPQTTQDKTDPHIWRWIVAIAIAVSVIVGVMIALNNGRATTTANLPDIATLEQRKEDFLRRSQVAMENNQPDDVIRIYDEAVAENINVDEKQRSHVVKAYIGLAKKSATSPAAKESLELILSQIDRAISLSNRNDRFETIVSGADIILQLNGDGVLADISKAVALLEEAVANRQDNATVLAELGRAHLRVGNVADAIARLEMAKSRGANCESDLVQALNKQLVDQQRLENPREEVKTLIKLAEFDPSNRQAHLDNAAAKYLGLGMNQLKARDIEGMRAARELFDAGLATRPSQQIQLTLLIRKASAIGGENRLEDAIAVIDEAKSIDNKIGSSRAKEIQDEERNILVAQANRYVSEGKWEQGIAVFKLAVNRGINDADLSAYAVRCYRTLGKELLDKRGEDNARGAESAFSNVLAIDPMNPDGFAGRIIARGRLDLSNDPTLVERILSDFAHLSNDGKQVNTIERDVRVVAANASLLAARRESDPTLARQLFEGAIRALPDSENRPKAAAAAELADVIQNTATMKDEEKKAIVRQLLEQASNLDPSNKTYSDRLAAIAQSSTAMTMAAEIEKLVTNAREFSKNGKHEQASAEWKQFVQKVQFRDRTMLDRHRKEIVNELLAWGKRLEAPETYLKAMDVYRQAEEISSPGEMLAQVLENKANCYLGMKSFREAAKDLARAREEALTNEAKQRLLRREYSVYLEWGDFDAARGYFADAAANFSKAVELDKTASDAYEKRANAYLQDKRFDKSVDDFETAKRFAKSNGERFDDQIAKCKVEQAADAERQEERERAIELLLEASTLDKKDQLGYVTKLTAIAEGALGASDNAAEVAALAAIKSIDLDKWSAARKKLAELHNQAGVKKWFVYVKSNSRGDLDNVLAEYSRAIEYHESNPMYVQSRAYALHGAAAKQTDSMEMVTLYSRAIDDYVKMRSNAMTADTAKQGLDGIAKLLGPIADKANAEKKYEVVKEVISGLRKVAAGDSGQANAMSILALLLTNAGDTTLRDSTAAMDFAVKANEVTNYKKADHLFALALAHWRLKQFDEAKKRLDEAKQVATEQEKAQIDAAIAKVEQKQELQ